MTPGDRIKERRLALGLTLEELGKKVGVGKSTVRKWETGYIANMRRDKIAKLADALGVSPLYIMGIEETDEPDAIDFLQHFSEHQKPTDNQQKLIDLASQLPDSELSVLISAAQSLVDLHKSQDAQE